MTITDRDRRLMFILPGLLIFVGYVVWLTTTGKFSEVRKARAEMAKAEEAAPSQDQLLHQQLHIGMANKSAAEAAAEVEAARTRFLATIRCADPVHRAERIHKLTSLLGEHGLVVIEHSEAGSAKEGLPATVEAFAKQLPIPAPPRLHRIKFAARYLDACELTVALSRDGTVAIPVGLTMMESPDDTDWHEWLLLVWV